MNAVIRSSLPASSERSSIRPNVCPVTYPDQSRLKAVVCT
jgi:hypothetical protein